LGLEPEVINVGAASVDANPPRRSQRPMFPETRAMVSNSLGQAKNYNNGDNARVNLGREVASTISAKRNAEIIINSGDNLKINVGINSMLDLGHQTRVNIKAEDGAEVKLDKKSSGNIKVGINSTVNLGSSASALIEYNGNYFPVLNNEKATVLDIDGRGEIISRDAT
jgi:hypothetical protein